MSSKTNALRNAACTPSLSFVNDTTFWQACLMWGLSTLFYFYDNLLQVSPSAMKEALFSAFVPNDEAFGSLSAYFLYAYGLMQIPAGLLVDKYGPRRLLTLAAFISGLGSLLMGLTNQLWLAKLARFGIGFGAAFAVVSCLKIASLWFKPRHFSLLTGIMITVGMLGAVFSLSTVGYVVDELGWRPALYVLGCTGFLLSGLIFYIVKDKHDKSQPLDSGHFSQTMQKMFQDLWKVMQNKQAWLIAIYAGLMFVPTLAFGGLWGIPFMQSVHGLDKISAGFSVSLIYVGWMLGAPLVGYLAERFLSDNHLMLLSNLLTLLFSILLIYLEQLPLWQVQSLLFGVGFFSSGFILAFGKIRAASDPALAGTTVGFTNALNTLGGALAQPLIGLALDFSGQSYKLALSVLPVALVLSLMALVMGYRATSTKS